MTSRLMSRLRDDPWAGLNLGDDIPAIKAPAAVPQAVAVVPESHAPQVKAGPTKPKPAPKRAAAPAKAPQPRGRTAVIKSAGKVSAPAQPATTTKQKSQATNPAKPSQAPQGLQAEANAAYLEAATAFISAPDAKASRPRNQTAAVKPVGEGSAPVPQPLPATTPKAMPAATEKLRGFGVNTTLTLPRDMKRALDLARADDGIDNTRRVRAMIEIWRDNTNVRRSIEKIARERAIQGVTIDTRIAITMQRGLLRDLNIARADDGIENTTRIRATIELWQTNERIRTMIDGLAMKHR